MKPDQIKRIRARLDMMQSEFALHLGVATLTVSQWETGVREPSKLAIAAIKMPKVELKLMEKQFRKEVSELFKKINAECFDNEIKEKYKIEISKRRKYDSAAFYSTKNTIVISRYYKNNSKELENVLKHEMVHCWLYERNKPYGHTAEFKVKLASITTKENKIMNS